MSPDPRAAARTLRPLIEAEADATDQAVTLTDKVVAAVAAANLFHLMVPVSLGGLEADADTILDVFEELSIADGSIGWTVMANASATSYVAFLDPEVAAGMVAGHPTSTTAGQFSPFAQVKREGDGYRVQGDFQFGSGTGHARYIGGAGFVSGPDGNPELMDDGLPNYRCFFVPRDGVEMKGGWDVMGLRGTGSFDYHVKDQRVAPGWTFGLFHYEVKSGGPLFGMGAGPAGGPRPRGLGARRGAPRARRDRGHRRGRTGAHGRPRPARPAGLPARARPARDGPPERPPPHPRRLRPRGRPPRDGRADDTRPPAGGDGIDGVPHRGGRGRRALRLPLGRQPGPAQPEPGTALLPRHVHGRASTSSWTGAATRRSRSRASGLAPSEALRPR